MIDMNQHPWVRAAQMMQPQPVMAAVNLDAVELTTGAEKQKAALLTVIDATGVKTVFIPPDVLQNIVAQAVNIIQGWNNEAAKGILIADKEMERQAVKHVDFENHIKKGKD